MTRKITLVGKRHEDTMTTPVFRDCLRCDNPILVGQKLITLSTDLRAYHAHLDCPDHE